MLRWLWPKPPLAAREKAWVETRMHWLADQLGIDRMLDSKVTLPTAEFFPGEYHGTAEDAQRLQAAICRFLQIDADFHLEVPGAVCSGGEAGLTGHRCQSGQSHLCGDTATLIATIAQKASCAILQRKGLPERKKAELEPLAELLTVFLGMGVFTANTAIDRRILPVRMSSYALSLFAWMREDANPAWASYLRLDAEAGFRTGLRYLRRSGDSMFQTATVRRRFGALSVNEVSRQLETGTPSVKIAALWELAEQGSAASIAVPLVVDFLHAKQPDIRAEAAVTLGHMGVNDTESIQRLTDALHDGEEGVRAAAAAALGTLRPQAPLAVPFLADALADRSPRVVRQVAHALCQFGGDAREATHGLFQALRAALVACDDVTADYLATALHAITPDPLSQLYAYVDEHDEDLFHVASQILQPPEE